jgi:predicted dehydrogenase
VWQLVERRLHVLPSVVVKDGIRALIDRTMHMFRRETVNFSDQFTSFVGRVLRGPAAPNTTTERVAGFALVHPRITELVLARKAHCWPVGPDCNSELASLIAFGGMACGAIARARQQGTSQIGICGSGLLAELVAAMVRLSGSVPVFSGRSADGVFFDAIAWCSRPRAAVPVWIVTPGTHQPRPQIIDLAIGCGVSASVASRVFPNARRVLSCSLTEMLRSEDYICDLFFDDGPCSYADWFAEDHFSVYVELLPQLTTRLKTVPARTIVGAESDGPESGTKFYSFANRIESSRSGQDELSQNDSGPGGPHVIPLVRSEECLVSLVGAGRWGVGMLMRQLVRHPAMALRGVCDRRPEVAYLAMSALPFQFATTNPADILADDQTGTVVISSYHGCHGPLAAATLRAGKHCFLEKPPVISRQQFDELAVAATQTDRILHVGYNRRFAPLTDLLAKHVAQQEGPLTLNFVMRSIDIPKNNWYYWASNGNRVLSNVCHLIDYALFWVHPGLPVELTTTSAGVGRVDENVVVTIRFEDGSLANILYTNRGSVGPKYYQNYLVARGQVIAEIRDFRKAEVRLNGKVAARSRGVIDLGHRNQMASFAEAIRSDGPPLVPLRDTLISARTVLAAAEALEARKSVRLSFDDIPASHASHAGGLRVKRAA